MKTSTIFGELSKIDTTKSLLNLEFICKEYGLPLGKILEYKYLGCKEVILIKDSDSFNVFSYRLDNKVYWFGVLIDGNDKSIFSDIEFTELPIVLETDTILDKISKYGLNSLHIKEFDYLYSLK
jgi:hypothetical protein